jgi:hypothetical protein
LSAAVSGRSPEDFDWILVQFNRLDIEPVIIAGQAVNIWGKTFREWDAANNPCSPKINDLLPLTSNDMELLEIRGISALDAFNGVVGRDKTKLFAKAAAPDTATYHLKGKSGLFKVQILAWLPGASREEIFKRLIPIRLGRHKAHVKVPDPVVMLSCKIANLATLNHTNPARNDYKHVLVLMCCLRALIGSQIQKGTLTRDVLKIIKRFDGVIKTRDAKKITKVHSLKWDNCIPFDLIEQAAQSDTAWKSFLKHRPHRG